MVIDFHTHILPSVDDGSKSVDNSLAMLRMEAEQGIKQVVLTPHFYANHDSPNRFIERRRRAEEKLRASMAQFAELPDILLGAEVHFFEGISDFEYLNTMAIGNTGCVLVEMPMRDWTDRMLLELEGIRQKRKLIPVVAHIDRYIGPFNARGLPERLAELPVLVQANASFFSNRLSRKLALKMLSQGNIHLLGSDCHDLRDRKPNLGSALKVIENALGKGAIEYINSHENKLVAEKAIACDK